MPFLGYGPARRPSGRWDRPVQRGVPAQQPFQRYRVGGLERPDVLVEQPALPARPDGPDLVLYGHGSLAQALREHGLIDEFRFAIHPVLSGRSQLLFRAGGKTPLTLVAAETLSTGIVVLSYQPSPA
jgi:dihydrofolate reductase